MAQPLHMEDQVTNDSRIYTIVHNLPLFGPEAQPYKIIVKNESVSFAEMIAKVELKII